MVTHRPGQAAQFMSTDGMIDKDIDERGRPLFVFAHVRINISHMINAPPTRPVSVHYRVNSSLNDFTEVTFVFLSLLHHVSHWCKLTSHLPAPPVSLSASKTAQQRVTIPFSPCSNHMFKLQRHKQNNGAASDAIRQMC